MFPVNGSKGNAKIVVVFKKYNMKLPWQNGYNSGERLKGEPSVESVENEDVVTLCIDASSSASLLEPVLKKMKVEKSLREELMDKRPRLEKHIQDMVVFKRKAIDKEKGKNNEKGKDKDKSKDNKSGKSKVKEKEKNKDKDKDIGRVQYERGPYKDLGLLYHRVPELQNHLVFELQALHCRIRSFRILPCH